MEKVIEEMTNALHKIEMEHWMNHDLFSIQWWSILLLNAILLIIFILFIDRQRILLISLAFMISYALTTVFDDIGEYFLLWSHPYQLVQFLSPLASVEFIVVPSIMALMYQTFSKWKFYLIADLIVVGIISFIVQPIFVYTDLYKLHNWTYFYSFIVLFIIGIIGKMVMDFIKNKQLIH
ncbi:CBO0543 family protein [Metabacillus sediminilitoris]|uniref:Uncharacterized protein n=1 Tax=Metabacillus sediminilitoris TaxID=2567941 RepID=A0A4S4C0F8_9BACI|nr:CBO0543 family protein [Metabacillus sediminilitoris]QGQ47856.1 hypothetical protein GMB29_22905 [Metabacillus sediminilitoris]THF81031.1 hypothetical protein E6W99_07665 [Metabacillus sediminilitoris]